jgi:hypothetical protein
VLLIGPLLGMYHDLGIYVVGDLLDERQCYFLDGLCL